MSRFLLTLLILLISLPCSAEQGGWTDREGNPVENKTSIKSQNGFGGWLLVTSDHDWQKKWNTPEDTIPHFTETDRLHRGEKISILPLFINAQVNDNNEILLTCDITIMNPGNEVTFAQQDLECFNEKRKGHPRNVRMVYTVIDIIADDNEPAGIWHVFFNINDKNSDRSVQLHTQFEIIE